MVLHTVTYKTLATGQIHADVYVPDGGAGGPTLVWIHGGALIFGHRGGIHPAQRDQYLAAGYVLVAIDYRLAPEVKLPAILEDVQDAFRWVRTQGTARFAIDPQRVASFCRRLSCPPERLRCAAPATRHRLLLWLWRHRRPVV